MAHSENLVKTIDAVMDDPELSIEQRIDVLGQEIISNAFFLIYKSGNQIKVTPEEDEEQASMMKRFNEINKVYNALMKSNRISASGNSAFDKDLLASIKNKKNSISGIVVSNTKEGQ